MRHQNRQYLDTMHQSNPRTEPRVYFILHVSSLCEVCPPMGVFLYSLLLRLSSKTLEVLLLDILRFIIKILCDM